MLVSREVLCSTYYGGRPVKKHTHLAHTGWEQHRLSILTPETSIEF